MSSPLYSLIAAESFLLNFSFVFFFMVCPGRTIHINYYLHSKTDSGKHGMTEPSAERSAELFSKTSEMVPNGLNIPMYES